MSRFSEDGRPTFAQSVRIVLSIGTLVIFTSCLVVPTDYHQVGARHNINEKSGEKLTVGVTTKNEVFLLLGEPDFASDDDDKIGYTWTKVKALIIVASYGGSGAFEVERSYVLEISFTNNLVQTARILKGWGSNVSPERELAKQPAKAQ